MQERSGAIIDAATIAKLREVGWDTGPVREIPDAELPAVQAMNRHERRAWAARKRREERAKR